MIKVSELIEKLKKFNPDDIVFANYEYERLYDNGELYNLDKDLEVLDVVYNGDYEAVMLVCSEG